MSVGCERRGSYEVEKGLPYVFKIFNWVLVVFSFFLFQIAEQGWHKGGAQGNRMSWGDVLCRAGEESCFAGTL